MTNFTIEQLEALKEGTIPGPWEWEVDQGIISLRGPGGEPIATDLTPDAADVLEASPALVNALIAEKRAHQKLRDEVEKVRDRKHALSKVQYQTARDLKNGIFDETFGTMPETHTVEAWEMGARSNQRTATALTRILEATNG